jgi:hypothetical protein
MGTGAGVRVATPAWRYGGLDLSCQATVGIDIIIAHHNVASRSAACYGSRKVDLGPVLLPLRMVGKLIPLHGSTVTEVKQLVPPLPSSLSPLRILSPSHVTVVTD